MSWRQFRTCLDAIVTLESTPRTHYEGRDLEILADAPRYQSWIVEQFLPYLRGSVVEYGAGHGSISILLAPRVERLDLVEPSSPLIGPLQQRLSSFSHVTIHNAMLESHALNIPDNSLDGIVMVNVLEHVEDDINALAQLMRILKPGGHLMLYVPALSWLMSELDRMHGHYRRYERQELRDKVSGQGFEVVRHKFMDFPGVVPWWLINVVGKQTSFNPRMIAIYDRWITPTARFLEGLVSPPIGKNLLLVARKP